MIQKVSPTSDPEAQIKDPIENPKKKSCSYKTMPSPGNDSKMGRHLLPRFSQVDAHVQA
jgi:hypothetical protein